MRFFTLILLISIASCAIATSTTTAAASTQNDTASSLSASLTSSIPLLSASSSSSSSSSTPTSTHTRGYGPLPTPNWSGHISVSNNRRHLWYWFFESSSSHPKKDPLILWLTGGPGCSSMIAGMMENGPYRIDPIDLSLRLNPFSWHTTSNIIYLDQPFTTGFSYSTDSTDQGPMTETEIAKDLLEFLQNFLAEFTQYQHSEVFVFGESYAGHYIPALAARIVRYNNNHGLVSSSDSDHGRKQNKHDHPSSKHLLRINLAGIGIGNGLVDPHTQYESYAPFAYDHRLITHAQYSLIASLTPGCTSLISQCSQNSTSEAWESCVSASVLCLYSIFLPLAATGINVYDIRRDCGENPLCYDMTPLEKFFAQTEVIEALDIRGKSFQECDSHINRQLSFTGDWMLNFANDLPEVLDAGVKVLVYSGDQDLICNWYGGFQWVYRLHWSGQSSYQLAPNRTWYVDGSVAGTSKTHEGLTFLRVNGCGHMCPGDRPAATLDMLKRFLQGKEFD